MNLISRIVRLFKKPLADDDTGVNPSVSDINNEIQLCSRCPFKGRCSWPGGCTSYQQIVSNRKAQVDKIRGYDAEAARESGDVFTQRHIRHGFGYLAGIGWRIQMDRNSYKIVRVVRIIDETSEAVVMAYDNGHTPNTKTEYRVKIPYVETTKGTCVVDLRALRSAVKASLNEWHVGQ